MIGKNHFFVVLTVILAFTGSAVAELHYFTQNATLFSTEGGGPLSSVAISGGGRYVGLAFDPSGTLWGSNASDNSFYTIDPNTGARTFQFSYTGPDIISFDFRTVGGTLQLFGMATDIARVFNASTGMLISSNDNFPGVNGGNFPSTAFDPTSSTYFGARGANTSLYQLEPDSGSATLIAALTDTSGNGISFALAGGAWFRGEYLSGFRNGNTIAFGDINTSTGVFTQDFSFGSFPAANAMGYAVIPAPGAALLAMLGLPIVGWVKRRFA